MYTDYYHRPFGEQLGHICDENCKGNPMFPPEEVAAARHRVTIKRLLRSMGYTIPQGIMQDTMALEQMLSMATGIWSRP